MHENHDADDRRINKEELQIVINIRNTRPLLKPLKTKFFISPAFFFLLLSSPFFSSLPSSISFLGSIAFFIFFAFLSSFFFSFLCLPYFLSFFSPTPLFLYSFLPFLSLFLYVSTCFVPSFLHLFRSTFFPLPLPLHLPPFLSIAFSFSFFLPFSKNTKRRKQKR